MLGSKYTTQSRLINISLKERDEKADSTILNYSYDATAEGGITAATGFGAGFSSLLSSFFFQLK